MAETILYDHRVRNPQNLDQWIPLEQVYRDLSDNSRRLEGDRETDAGTVKARVPLMAEGAEDTPIYIDSTGAPKEITDLNADLKNKILANTTDVDVNKHSPLLTISEQTETVDGVTKKTKIIGEKLSDFISPTYNPNDGISNIYLWSSIRLDTLDKLEGSNDCDFISFGDRPSYSTDNGLRSVTIGSQLKASHENQVVLGRYNLDGDYPFSIGNGTSNITRSNLFSIDSGGNVIANGTTRTYDVFLPVDSDDGSSTGYTSLKTRLANIEAIASAEQIYVGPTQPTASNYVVWIQTT